MGSIRILFKKGSKESRQILFKDWESYITWCNTQWEKYQAEGYKLAQIYGITRGSKND